MSLKEEIDKLIQSERAKLENRDKERAEIDEQTRLRFQPLKVLLREIVESFDSKYIKAHFGDMVASIAIDNTTWNISPSRQFNFGKNVYQLKDGFEIKETSHYDFSGFEEAETIEQTKMFPNEQDVATYLTVEIAKEVAYHQHLNKGKA